MDAVDKRTKEYKDLQKAIIAKTEKQDADDTPKDGVEHVGLASAPSEVEKPKHRVTKPWERRDSIKPWKPDFYRLESKHEGFRPRWVTEENIENRISRGWVIADPKHYGEVTDSFVSDTKPLGRHIRRRRQILMEIPEEGAQAYEAQKRDVIARRKRDAKEIVRKQAEELLKKAGYAIKIVEDKEK